MLTADELAARLIRAREQRGLRTAELADAAGISRQALYHLERGERFGSIATYMLIADALGMTVGELLGDTRGADKR